MSSASPRTNGSRTLRRVIIIAALGIVTLLVILRLSGFRASWEKFLSLELKYVALALAVHYFAFWLRAVRWKVLLSALGQVQRISTLFSYILVGWFISAAVPARAGDVARAYLLKNDRGIPLRKSMGSIVVERAMDGAVIFTCSLLFSFFILSLGLPQWVLTLYQVTFSVLLLLLISLYLMPRWEHRVRSLFVSSRYNKLSIFLFRMIDYVRNIAKCPGRTMLSLALTVVIWFCDALVTYLVLLSLDYSLPLPWVAFISFTVNLAAIVPITPGAVGQIDAVQYSLFTLIGVARDVSGVTILISRFICFWSFLLVSGLFTYGSGLARLIRTLPGRKGFMESSVQPAGRMDRLSSKMSK